MSVNVYDPVNDTLIPVAGATLFADTPIGVIQAFDAEEVPDGWLIFNGQTKNRADYPDLWARANRNNQVGVGKFYGIGDGSTTFTLADLRETSLKGYGETSRSVGAHVKSGGLGIGEFIDDRVQEHQHHYLSAFGEANWNVQTSSVWQGGKELTTYVQTGRSGTTTEVKAVGVVWAVKAKMTGLPIDLKAEVDDVVNEVTTGEATAASGITFTENMLRKNNKTVYLSISGTISSNIAGSGAVVATLPTAFRPSTAIPVPFMSNYSGEYNAWKGRINTDGTVTTATGGGEFQFSFSVIVSYVL